jgi:tetratricopeptide (TPR) repeat protein
MSEEVEQKGEEPEPRKQFDDLEDRIEEHERERERIKTFISSKQAEFLSDATPDQYGHKAIAGELGVLPVYQSEGGFLAIDPERTALAYDKRSGPFCIIDWVWILIANAEAASAYPELSSLRDPMTIFADADLCSVCNGTGHVMTPGIDEFIKFFDKDTCTTCAGLGRDVVAYYKKITQEWEESERRKETARLSQIEATVARCTKLIQCDESDFESYYHRGTGWLELGDCDKALSDFDTVARLKPNDPYGYVGRGHAYEKMQQYENALDAYTTGLKFLTRQELPKYKGKSMEEYRQHIQEQRKSIERSLFESRANVTQTSVLKQRAEVLERLGRLDEALVDISQAIAIGKDHVDILLCDKKFKLYEKLDRNDAALADLSALIASHPDAWYLYGIRADLHKKLGQKELADNDRASYRNKRRHYQADLDSRMRKTFADSNVTQDTTYQAIEFHPHFSPPYKFYKDTSEARRDIEKYTRIIAELPDDGEIYWHRARAHAEIGDGEQAVQDFRSVLRLHPTHWPACSASAEILIGKPDSADHALAVDLLSEGLRYSKTESNLLDLRAAAHERLGNFDAALNDLTEALRSGAFYHERQLREDRGLLLEKMGRLSEAAEDKRIYLNLRGSPSKGESYKDMYIQHWAYMDVHGHLAIELEAERCNSFKDGLAPVRASDRFMYGYINTSGAWSIPPQFGAANLFHEQLACVSFDLLGKRFGKFGFTNKAGQIVVKPKYDESWACFREGYATVTVGKKKCIIDSHGAEIVPPLYDEISSFRDGLSRANTDGKYGYLNTSGQLVIELKFENAENFNEGRARVMVDHKWGYIDTNGNWIVKPQYEDAQDFYEGRAMVATGGKWGVIDAAGNIVVQPKYASVGPFCEGLAWVWIDKDFGAIDLSGAVVIAAQFPEVHNFEDGLAAVKLKEKWGFVDKSGTTVIKTKFDEVRDFKEGLAAIKTKDKWGFVDKSSKLLVKPQFDEVRDIHEGLAAVGVGAKGDRKWGFVNQSGAMVASPQFDSAHQVSEGLALVGSLKGFNEG